MQKQNFVMKLTLSPTLVTNNFLSALYLQKSSSCPSSGDLAQHKALPYREGKRVAGPRCRGGCVFCSAN